MQKLLAGSAIGVVLAALAPGSAALGQVQAAGGDTMVLEEIVVTARKRSESLQDVPASIQAVGQEQIQSLNVSSLSDLNGATPNASIAPSGSTNAGAITIRGITSLVRNAGFEAGAAVYVDGVFQGRPTGNNQDLVDIERVEILRGPQGTLYGKNTTAGAFSLTTVSPGDDWRGSGFVRYGSRQELQAAAYAAGPLVEDMVGVKLAAYRRRQDGYQQDVAAGRKYGNADVFGTRGQLRFTPANWTIDLRGDYVKDQGSAAKQEPVTSPAVTPGRDTIASNLLQPNSVKGGGTSLTVEHDFGFATATSVSAWRKLTTTQVTDDDYYAVPIPVLVGVSHDWTDKARQFSQELRLTSNSDGPFSYVAGLYYFDQFLDSSRPFSLAGVPNFFYDFAKIKTKSYAAFVNADYEVTDDLTLTVGLRYTDEKKRLDFEQKGYTFGPLNYPTIPRSIDRFSDSDLSPTASLKYEFTPDVTGYVTVSRGFKAGGWNPDITKRTSAEAIRFDSEKVTNYEAGLRTQFLERRLTVNLTGYHMNYDNLQISQFLPASSEFIITNAGKAVIDGAELEVITRPASWLTVHAGGAHNDAHYTQFLSGTGGDFSGQQFTNAPKWSGYIAADATLPVTPGADLLLHGDYRYESKVFFDDSRTVNQGLAYARDGYGLVNARIGVQTEGGVEISVYAQNLTKKRVLLNRTNDLLGLGIVLDSYGPPRTFGVRAAAHF